MPALPGALRLPCSLGPAHSQAYVSVSLMYTCMLLWNAASCSLFRAMSCAAALSCPPPPGKYKQEGRRALIKFRASCWAAGTGTGRPVRAGRRAAAAARGAAAGSALAVCGTGGALWRALRTRRWHGGRAPVLRAAARADGGAVGGEHDRALVRIGHTAVRLARNPARCMSWQRSCSRWAHVC